MNSDFPGSRSLEERLRTAGIHTCADVRRLSREALQRDYGGKTGDMLFSYARGVDIKELEPNQKRKSVSEVRVERCHSSIALLRLQQMRALIKVRRPSLKFA